MILFINARGIFGQLRNVIKHDSVLRRERSSCVVFLQRPDKLFVQRDPTQKLCVRFDSIKAAVGHGDHRCNHLVLASAQG